jgi:hypothetical protein
MFNMRVSNAVSALVEAWFPKPQGEGLLITLDLRLQNPKCEWQRASGNVSFVFERPTNYCRVFASATQLGWDIPELAEWKMYSHHDSCWRDAIEEVIVKEYFRQARAVNSKMAPANMQEWAYIHTIKPVKLAWTVDEEESKKRRDNYMKRLTHLEII